MFLEPNSRVWMFILLKLLEEGVMDYFLFLKRKAMSSQIFPRVLDLRLAVLQFNLIESALHISDLNI